MGVYQMDTERAERAPNGQSWNNLSDKINNDIITQNIK